MSHTVIHELNQPLLEDSGTVLWGSDLEGASWDVTLVFGEERCHEKVFQCSWDTGSTTRALTVN